MKLSMWLSIFKDHQEKHVFSVSDLSQLTQQRKELLEVELSRLVKKGIVERIARGWYANPFSPPTLEETSMVLRHPSYISMEYSLSLQNILSQSACTITLVTTKKPYTYEQGGWTLEYHQMIKGLFWGFWKEDQFYLAEPEKALLDLIYIRHVRNRELDTNDMASLMDDMYLEELDKMRLVAYAHRFGGNITRIISELLP